MFKTWFDFKVIQTKHLVSFLLLHFASLTDVANLKNWKKSVNISTSKCLLPFYYSFYSHTLPASLLISVPPCMLSFPPRRTPVFTCCLAAAHDSRASVLGVHWGVSAPAGGHGEIYGCVHGSAGERIVGPDAQGEVVICSWDYQKTNVEALCCLFFCLLDQHVHLLLHYRTLLLNNLN